MIYELKRKFINYRGVDLYKEASISSVSGKLNPGSLTSFPENINTSIIFPVNQRKYDSKDYLKIYKKGTKLDKDLDLLIIVKNGYIIPTPGNIDYTVLQGILPKYHTDKSDWDYKFYHDDNHNIVPLITVPSTKKGWEEVCKVFCEFAIFYSIFGNCKFIVHLKKENNNPKEKLFSWIPTIISLGYRQILFPHLSKKISKNLGEASNIKLSPGTTNKILKYAESKYSKDCYFVNMGDGSFFMNPSYMTKEELVDCKKRFNSSRLRCEGDWILKAYEDKKRLIMYSDLDSPVAIAHEIGHLEIDLEGGIKKSMQRYGNSGILGGKNKFMQFIIMSLGAFGDSGELIGTVLPVILRTPVIFYEYLASYKGLCILEEIGLGKEDIDKARNYYKKALSTYLIGATRNIGLASIGKILKKSFKKFI